MAASSAGAAIGTEKHREWKRSAGTFWTWGDAAVPQIGISEGAADGLPHSE